MSGKITANFLQPEEEDTLVVALAKQIQEALDQISGRSSLEYILTPLARMSNETDRQEVLRRIVHMQRIIGCTDDPEQGSIQQLARRIFLISLRVYTYDEQIIEELEAAIKKAESIPKTDVRLTLPQIGVRIENELKEAKTEERKVQAAAKNICLLSSKHQVMRAELDAMHNTVRRSSLEDLRQKKYVPGNLHTENHNVIARISMYCGRLKSEALIIIKEGTKIRHEDRQIRKDLQKFKKARE